jgi:uncharacterized protein (DUF1697 family)
MRDAIHQSTGLDVVVVTRTGPEWTAAIEANPFEDVDDGTKLHVTFFTDPITDAIRRIDATPFEPERVVFGHRELYMSLPYGAGRSKLAVSLTRADRAGAGTARNWNTLEAIAELLATGVDQ